jgi:retinol dehydrogenase-12
MINPGSVNTGLHRDGDMAIKLFDRFIGRTLEEVRRLLTDVAAVKGTETHGSI